MIKGAKFLKKLWCCISREVQQGNSVVSTELTYKLATFKSFKADVLSFSPSSKLTHKLSALKLFSVTTVELANSLLWS